MYDIILPYVDRAYDTDHTAISLDFPVPFPDAHLHRLASEFETSDRARPPRIGDDPAPADKVPRRRLTAGEPAARAATSSSFERHGLGNALCPVVHRITLE
ncbi:hypothetical protein [Burkholderia diffusa]|uniref:hypothetical protein n=1 Tax=Burkholderia diffusa TaxID=488732 RepID=UPI0012D99D4E|nr:hypothetical protein [Burkholderia diffusa]